MKRIVPLILLLAFTASAAQAQLFKKRSKSVKKEYSIGTIATVNNKVTFNETIPAPGLTAKEVEEVVTKWFAERFVKPTVIGFKAYEPEVPGTLVAKAEEYIVFKNTFFVLNRSRIAYFMNITCKDGSCIFDMSRITYWWDEEADDGGRKMTAEECITDEHAINKKGGLHKFNGKFRTKTIDLKNILVEDLKNRLKAAK